MPLSWLNLKKKFTGAWLKNWSQVYLPSWILHFLWCYWHFPPCCKQGLSDVHAAKPKCWFGKGQGHHPDRERTSWHESQWKIIWHHLASGIGQLPSSLQDSVVMEHLPSQQLAVMGKEDIRIHVFLPILDSMIAEIELFLLKIAQWWRGSNP